MTNLRAFQSKGIILIVIILKRFKFNLITRNVSFTILLLFIRKLCKSLIKSVLEVGPGRSLRKEVELLLKSCLPEKIQTAFTEPDRHAKPSAISPAGLLIGAQDPTC